MKNDGQPIRYSVPRNSRCTKDPRWLNNVFLFSTEIWADQLKKHPVCIVLPKSESDMYLRAGSNDSWQGHRLRGGDGRTSSEQVRQLTKVNKKLRNHISFASKDA